MDTKLQSPADLARLLDRLTVMYPHGIPLASIRHDSGISDAGEVVRDFAIFVFSDGSPISQEARVLLDGILTKGLRLSEEGYSIFYGNLEAIERAVAQSQSEHLIVFGIGEGTRSQELSNGRSIIYTDSLDLLVSDSTRKRELWRSLQGLNL